ncbi:PAS domain-containing sensor histidine kinase [Azospirillum brasilense]|nr:PAS domain-containing sensor histidine kinase [Azospirillum brasilense]MDW7555040.1 PAS domain-containing sensor histidine kinase [Azospirillum brasilense]TVZ50721.1 PAS domain S-box-containing protein [Azospirillum brasilense]TWB85498.1 PAS domain S-box-containing protein [Azospirillum brasilense]
MRSLERYVHALMAGAGDIVAVLSSDGRFIDVGSACLGVLGIPPEALLGTPVLERVHPDDRDEAVRRLAGCGHGTSVENGGPFLCRVRHAAGGWRHMETTAFNRPDDPKIRGIVIHARDVTDRVETEQRLRASEALYQTLARSAPVGIFQTDRDGGIVFANPRFAAIAGLSSDALSGHAWRASLHPEDRTRLEADWAQAVAAGLPVLLNLRFCATDGTITFALCQGSPLTDADGRVQGWVGTLTDMTEYVRTADALLMAEARTNAIVDAAADAIVTMDGEGIVHSFNPAAEAMFGIPAADMLWSRIDRLIPDIGALLQDGGLAVYQPGGEAHGAGAVREAVAVRGGDRFPIELSVSAVETGGRRVFTGIIRDITARKRSEGDLIAAKEAAESADRAKSTFLQVMSHELRTPLNAVIGFAQVIEMRLLGVGEVDRYIDYAGSIRQSGEHLLAIIDDILDITTIEAGGLRLNECIVDPSDLVGEALNLVAIQAGKRGVPIRIDLEDGLPMLFGDALRLRQVLVNLLSNAVKFSNPGETAVVRARRRSDGGVELSVTDTGIGIAAEDLPTAMTPFAQVDQSMARRYEGMGLGLSISKRLVEAHGGTLRIDSVPGQGTTVTVALPPSRRLADA